MNRSEQINELATALAKAQGQITGALKDSSNPYYSSKYADLASVWDACRKPLSENGLAVIQMPGRDESGNFVETILSHSSGQWFSSKLHFKPGRTDKNGVFIPLEDSQALGSGITYIRRYALSAMVGIAPEDDDGNAASGKQKTAAEKIDEKVKVPHDNDGSEFSLAGEYVLPITVNKGKRLSVLTPQSLATARSVAERNNMTDVVAAIDRFTKANDNPLGFDATPKEAVHA